jgi:hypothetical protein
MAFTLFRARQSETQKAPAKEEEWFNNGFRQISDSGVYISRIDAKRSYASEVLEEDGLRLMKYDEVLKEMSKSLYLRKALEGKLFHIDGSGSTGGYGIFDGNGRIPVPDYYTFNDKGELTKGRGEIRKNVHVYTGRYPLVFYVPMEHAVEHIGANFIIYANQSPSYIASIVVGAKKHARAEPEILAENKAPLCEALRVA